VVAVQAELQPKAQMVLTLCSVLSLPLVVVVVVEQTLIYKELVVPVVVQLTSTWVLLARLHKVLVVATAAEMRETLAVVAELAELVLMVQVVLVVLVVLV
jgi:hypothetical protein